MRFARVLFLADSHLGIDQPVHPRVARRRRGDDFMANYLQALRYAVDGNCDAVVHGGDVFHRSRVRPELVQSAFVPLKKLADLGLPVFVVPGNHERSRIPHAMLALHPGIHIFDRPRTFVTNLRGHTVAISGFPYARSVRHEFPRLLAQTEWDSYHADVRLLCVHHCFEGATVGPSGFTFRTAKDVVRHVDVPNVFSAVLTGHIHRHQVLRYNLQNRRLGTPVFYPGSIERTSFAERDEKKGFLELAIAKDELGVYRITPEFHELSARPMVTKTIRADISPDALRGRLEVIVSSVPPNAIIRLMVSGSIAAAQAELLSAAALRALAGPTATIEIRPATVK